MIYIFFDKSHHPQSDCDHDQHLRRRQDQSENDHPLVLLLWCGLSWWILVRKLLHQVDEEANTANNKDQLRILNWFWEGQSFNDHNADDDESNAADADADADESNAANAEDDVADADVDKYDDDDHQ